MQLMHDLGICVSPRSVLRKKKGLVAEQEKKIHSTVTAYVKRCENSKASTGSQLTCTKKEPCYNGIPIFHLYMFVNR